MRCSARRVARMGLAVVLATSRTSRPGLLWKFGRKGAVAATVRWSLLATLPQKSGRVISWDTGYFERTLTMRNFVESVKKFLQAEDGPTAVEYAVMLALIIVVCLAAISALGTQASTTFQGVADTIGGS